MTTVVAPNRDVGVQQSGFRLQKLRAVELLLSAVEKNPAALVYAAIETDEDVNLVQADESGKVQFLEQDKEYDEATGFSYQNEQVLKAVCNFITNWASRDFSSSVYFGFYATNRISKERKTELSEELHLQFPDKAILELLSQKNYPYLNLLECTKALLLNYAIKKSALSSSVLETVQKWVDRDWMDFFTQIEWKFGQGDVEEVKTRLLKQISTSKMYKGRSLQDREEIILSRLVDLLDERQALPTPSERFVYGADVKNIYLEVSTGASKIDDPTWNLWNQIQLTDKRGLVEKINAICTSYPDLKIDGLARKASAGLLFHQKASTDKRVISVRYRVYDCAKEALDEFILANGNAQLTVQTLDQKINEVVEVTYQKITELSKDYDYPISNKETIREIVLELVDSCYLAFDDPKGTADE